MNHNCKAITFICMDWRLQTPEFFAQLRQKTGIENFDLISLPGAAKNIVDKKEAMAELIGLSDKLHCSDTIIVTNHFDCGAFGQNGKDNQILMSSLSDAAAMLAIDFPQKKIIKVFVELWEEDGSWKTACNII